MSIFEKLADIVGSSTPIETIVEFDSVSNPVIEDSSLLFSAEFGRDGADLVLSNFGQSDIRIIDYFRSDQPADLLSKDGRILAGDVVEKLAGPEFPGQYAQAGSASESGAIGQVESISGQVTVLRASGVRETLALGAKVFTNDVVQTGNGGALSLTFVDGTIFTLAESSRMVLDSLIYDPASSSNSGIFNLVEGSFVFIAGEVAKTGGMEVKTPAATMGIRGTTVLVKIVSNNGVSEVEVSLNQDPDGALGQFTITGLDGSVIANIDSIATKWLISPVEGQTREITRTPEELGTDQEFLGQAIGAYRIANQRVNDGGEFVDTESSGPQEQQDSENDPDAPQDEQPEEPGDETPETEPDEDEQRGELGSGIDTELATDTSQPESVVESVVISGLVTGGEVTPVGVSQPSEEAPFSAEEEPIESEPVVGLVNLPPDITPPTVTTEVLEDGSVVLNGYSFSDPDGDILTASISAGSSLTLSTGSGVTLLEGTGVEDEVTVIRGTGEQISDALNGAVYQPTPDADVSGTLTVELSDGELSTTNITVINIVPEQDAPVALPDVLVAGQNDSGITGNLLANDYDVDTNPAPDELSVVKVTVDGVDYDLTGGAVSVSLASGARITVSQDGSYSFYTNNVFGALADGEVFNETTINYTLSDGHEEDHGEIVTGALSVTVTGVNDVPVITGDGEITVVESHTVTLTSADLLSEDVDHSASDLIYTITTGPSSGQLELVEAKGVPVTAFTQQQIDDGDVVYVHHGSLDTTDIFSFTVTDGLASINGNVDVAITQLNDDPSGAGIPISLTITEDTAASLDLSSLTLSDPDSAGAPVTLTLIAENAGLSAGSTATVTVIDTETGLAIEGSIADLNAALSDPAFITLSPAADLFGTGAASVSVSISDNGNTGTGGGDDIEIGTIAVNITAVNDAPDLTVADQEIEYIENDSDTAITTSVTIDDPDDSLIEFAVVKISENYQLGDILKFTDTAAITGEYDIDTGILALTGSDTLTNYTTALESITYSHATDVISEAVRTITYVVDDGEGNSNQATATISPIAVNDAPQFTEVPTEVFVDEDITQILNFSDIEPFGETIFDPDSGDSPVELTFTLSSGVLTFPPGGDGISISNYTITGTVADINDYLNNGGTDEMFVRFTPDLDSTETVDLNITINDLGNTGAGGALTDSIDVEIIVFPVDDPAEVTLSVDANSFVEDDGPIVIDSAVTITDVDSPMLTRAGVAITENFQAGSDVLAFTDTETITGSFDATNGVLILSGTDTLAAYEAALSSVTYQNTSDNPDAADRTILFNVDDGAGFGFSDMLTVSVTPRNDAPVLTEFPDEFHVDEDITQEINFYDLEPFGETFSDPDAADNLVTLTFTLSGGVLTLPPGGDAVAIDGYMLNGTVAAINNYLNNGGTDETFVRFTTDQDSTDTVNLNILVDDLGNSGSGGPLHDSVDLEIIVFPVDDPAAVTLSQDTNSFTANGASITIDNLVSIADVDSPMLTRAGVAITENFQVGSDVLSFTDTATITGSYDETNGVLILSGTDTLAAYETALSSVTYHNTLVYPDAADRTILFNVDDGAGFGNSDEIIVSISTGNNLRDIRPEAIAASAKNVLNGGDVITTGAGDDEITIGDSLVDFIDAGSGTDTLKFGDAGSFDLTNINDLRLRSIEALDTANGLVNSVTLGITDIFQISDDANTQLETLLNDVLPTSFVIDADANDTYTFENGSAGGVWTINMDLSASVTDYDVYEYVETGSADVLATLAIDDDVTPTIV